VFIENTTAKLLQSPLALKISAQLRSEKRKPLISTNWNVKMNGLKKQFVRNLRNNETQPINIADSLELWNSNNQRSNSKIHNDSDTLQQKIQFWGDLLYEKFRSKSNKHAIRNHEIRNNEKISGGTTRESESKNNILDQRK